MIWRFDLALAGASEGRIYWATDTHADGLLIGAAIAFFLDGGGFDRFPRVLKWVGPLSAIGLTAMLVTVAFNLYYLWHFPIFHELGVLKLPGEEAPWADALLAWGLTFAGALGSYLLIERRALGYKDRFSWRGRAMPVDVIKDRPSPRQVEVPAVSVL